MSLIQKEEGNFEFEDKTLPPAKQPNLTYNAVYIDSWKEKQGNDDED